MVVTNNKHYKHLNQDQRIEIYSFKQQGLSNRKISKIIGVSHSTISREITRNSIDYGRGNYKYKPIKAQQKYLNRRFKANYMHTKLVKNHSLSSKIHHILSNKNIDRGIDEILGRLKLEGRDVVSTSTAYRFIRNNTNRSRYLLHKSHGYGKYKRNKGRSEGIKGIKSIDERPDIVNNKERIGDWEIDTVVSCRTGKGGLFTSTERTSKYDIIKKVGNLKKDTLYHTMKACFQGEKVYTLTTDNGSEFCDISKLQKDLNITCYKAHPYCSFERGINERHNGFIRRYIPKGSDISKYTDKEISLIQNKLNHKPRKCLDYRTPYEVYHNTNLNYIS